MFDIKCVYQRQTSVLFEFAPATCDSATISSVIQFEQLVTYHNLDGYDIECVATEANY